MFHYKLNTFIKIKVDVFGAGQCLTVDGSCKPIHPHPQWPWTSSASCFPWSEWGRPLDLRPPDLRTWGTQWCWCAEQRHSLRVRASNRGPWGWLWCSSDHFCTWEMGTFVTFPCFQKDLKWHTQMTYSSMAATSAVLIFPLVLRALDTRPSNSSPNLAIFSSTSLTSSPRYIPLTIFSKLWIKTTMLSPTSPSSFTCTTSTT